MEQNALWYQCCARRIPKKNKIFDGGLDIITLEHQVPLMKIKCIDRLSASNDQVIREILSMEGAESLLANELQRERLRSLVDRITSKIQAGKRMHRKMNY